MDRNSSHSTDLDLCMANEKLAFIFCQAKGLIIMNIKIYSTTSFHLSYIRDAGLNPYIYINLRGFFLPRSTALS